MAVTTNKRRILFVGCSFTADSGFTLDHQAQYHWPWLVSQHYDCLFHNAGIGGSSNDAIFHRTIQNLATSRYDLVVVQWSGIDRYWAYLADDNIDNFTILNGGRPVGFRSDQKYVQDYGRLHYSYFNNQYMNLCHWLSKVISLESLLKSRKQPFIFVKGFDNYIKDLICCVGYGHDRMSPELRGLLNFHNSPDHLIENRLEQLMALFLMIDPTVWANLNHNAFNDLSLDLSDDGEHPGPLANESLFWKIVTHCDRRGGLTPSYTRQGQGGTWGGGGGSYGEDD